MCQALSTVLGINRTKEGSVTIILGCVVPAVRGRVV